jgi:hypothetical protein
LKQLFDISDPISLDKLQKRILNTATVGQPANHAGPLVRLGQAPLSRMFILPRPLPPLTVSIAQTDAALPRRPYIRSAARSLLARNTLRKVCRSCVWKRDDIIGTLNVAIRRGALVLLGGLDGVSADREVAPRHEQVGQRHHALHLGKKRRTPRSLAVTLKSTHCQCHLALEPA